MLSHIFGKYATVAVKLLEAFPEDEQSPPMHTTVLEIYSCGTATVALLIPEGFGVSRFVLNN